MMIVKSVKNEIQKWGYNQGFIAKQDVTTSTTTDDKNERL